METSVINATEYRNLPLESLTESPNNPRKNFSESALNELAESIKAQGILSPLVVRPVNNHFEIVAGARRYRAAQRAGLTTAPVRIVELADAQAIEMSIVENLIRAEVHPMEEASGFKMLLDMEEHKYTIEQISARTGKSPSFIAQRLRLNELVPSIVEAFYRDEIGVGHALLLAKLQPAEQEEALGACYQQQYNASNKAKRILLPVRHLQQWIENNILLELAAAPFSTEDATLLHDAGSCLECAKRTGYNTLLFEGITHSGSDHCSDPKCYATKLDAHVKNAVAAKPKLVQISTAYGKPAEGSPIVPRNRYMEIRSEKPTNPKQRDWPEYKVCKFTTEAIVADGNEKGVLKRVCSNPDCPIHHARKQRPATDAAFKAQQEKRRREEAIANATGLRVLSAIGAAVPVRLMKRDLLFICERLAAAMDERRLVVLLRIHGIGKASGSADESAKLLASFLRKADESTISRVLVAIAVLQSTHGPNESSKALREAAEFYKVDVAAITTKVKLEFAAKEKTHTTRKPTSKENSAPPRTIARKAKMA